MVAWIIIYSFFPSSDFVNEVVVLFGEVNFWATVLVSVFIALSQSFVADTFVLQFTDVSFSPAISSQVLHNLVHTS